MKHSTSSTVKNDIMLYLSIVCFTEQSRYIYVESWYICFNLLLEHSYYAVSKLPFVFSF